MVAYSDLVVGYLPIKWHTVINYAGIQVVPRLSCICYLACHVLSGASRFIRVMSSVAGKRWPSILSERNRLHNALRGIILFDNYMYIIHDRQSCANPLRKDITSLYKRRMCGWHRMDNLHMHGVTVQNRKLQ